MIKLGIAGILSSLLVSAFLPAAWQHAQLTIWNTEDFDVVIGVYTPSNGGIDEKLIPISANTAITDIPIKSSRNQQFVIAYKATAIDGKLLRSKPLTILGQGVIHILSDEQKPFAILQFRGKQNPQSSWTREFVSYDNEKMLEQHRAMWEHRMESIDYSSLSGE